ncbi:MAG: hypothetical protein Q8Q73_02460 [Stagnimonas sp.]|nr:hypothetical protein [Stagnimonas sp.]
MKALSWRTPLLMLLLALGTAQAEEETGNPDVFGIELQADDRIKGGESAFLQGETDAKGVRFAVAETQLMQPISVGVYTRTPQQKLRLRIVKDDWDKPVRDVVTKGGQVDLHFRTYDGFKLEVSADERTEYQLVVWRGEEVIPQLPAVAVPASKYREPAAAGAASSEASNSGHSFSTLELALIGLLLLIGVGGGAYLVGRRKSV